METNRINHLRVRGWDYDQKYRCFREEVVTYQCASQKRFSRCNATLFFLLGIVYILLDRFLWNKFQVATLFYFVVCLFSTVNYLLYQKILPLHRRYVVAAGCLYILILQKLLLTLNIIGGGVVSWTLLLCSFLSTSLVIVVPSYYIAVTVLTMLIDMVEYSFSNPDIVYIFYNLMDDLILAVFCIGINLIFSHLKYEELERKEILSERRR